LIRNTTMGLEAVGYRAAVEEDAKAPYSNIPESIGAVIDNAAKKYGVDAGALRRIAWLESKGDPKAKNPKSSAGGLFQQIDSNAKQYGVADRFDAAQSADGAARFMRDNIAYLTKELGRAPTTG